MGCTTENTQDAVVESVLLTTEKHLSRLRVRIPLTTVKPVKWFTFK